MLYKTCACLFKVAPVYWKSLQYWSHWIETCVLPHRSSRVSIIIRSHDTQDILKDHSQKMYVVYTHYQQCNLSPKSDISAQAIQTMWWQSEGMGNHYFTLCFVSCFSNKVKFQQSLFSPILTERNSLDLFVSWSKLTVGAWLTFFSSVCTVAGLPAALNAGAGPCSQCSSAAQMGPSHSSHSSSHACGRWTI